MKPNFHFLKEEAAPETLTQEQNSSQQINNNILVQLTASYKAVLCDNVLVNKRAVFTDNHSTYTRTCAWTT